MEHCKIKDGFCGTCGKPASRPGIVRNCRLGLGGMVKSALSAIGITEERVSKAIGRPCGCGKRAEKLDELGRKLGIG